ncbi:hypothetical protein ACHAW6_012589 [Cyclotella cf. meneghiniana]
MLYATNMLTKYASNPRKEHGKAILYIPDSSKEFYSHADVDFSVEWNKDFSKLDPSTTKSISGWFILYANCPVIWYLKIQSQVALSSTKAKYIDLSHALQDAIPVMSLLSEMREGGFHIISTMPRIFCRAFETTQGLQNWQDCL